jgi:hypothetical protein
MTRPNAAAAADPCADPQNGLQVVGGFEIDGNLCTNNASNLDWDAAGTQPVATDPVGNADFSGFTQGVGEVDGPNWTVAQTTSNGIPGGQARSDLSNVYSYSQIVGGNVFAYFGFQLLGGTGTMSVHIELNQKPNNDPSCPRDNRGVPSPCRTPGDLLLAFDKDGSNPITLAAAWTWSGSQWVPRPGGVAGIAVGRANNANIHTLTGGTLAAGQFGEVAVNMTTLFGPVGCSGNFGTMNMRTSASTTLTSALIDWVQPVQLGVPSTCPTVVLQKRWLNGANGDTARLRINGATTAPGAATSTANGAPDFTDPTHAHAEVDPGSTVNLAETLPAPGQTNNGTYTSTLGCDDGILTPPLPGRSGSFTMPVGAGAGDTITCTFTNTRNQATLTFTKVWAAGSIPGDTADLSIQTGHGTTGPTTSTAPTSTTITSPVFSGEPVTVVEGLGNANASSYSATTTCVGNVNNLQPGDFGASFTVPNTPTDIACTITNAPVPTQLTLLKSWVNGANGDTAGLTVTNQTTLATDSAIATVPAGGNGQSRNAATVPILAGQRVTLSETLPGPGQDNSGTYDPTALECNDAPVPFTVTGTGATGTFTVPPSGAPVTCAFTNTRQTANLIVRKRWVNGAAGDSTELQVSGSNPVLGPLNAVSVASGAAGGEIDAANRIQTGVFTGQHITVTEALGGSNTGTYTSSLDCNNGVEPNTNGTFTLPAALANTTVTCTFTNTRHRANLIVRKRWVNGAAGDQAELQLTGTNPDLGPLNATSIASGATGSEIDAANRIRTGVFAGQQLTVTESLPPDNTGAYTSSLACDNGVHPNANGQFTLTQAQASTTVTCTFTNTRHRANLIVRKRWVDGAAGDQADLQLSGTNPDLGPLTATSVASGAAGSEIDAANRIRTGVFAGQHITVSESLLPGNTGAYDSTLDCDNGVNPNPDGTFTLTAAQADTTVTCTFTNTRQRANLIVRKRWVNGAAGDQADLQLTGTNPDIGPLTQTSVASGAAGSEIDATNRIRTGVFPGQHLTVTENLGGGNTGSYTSSLACDNGVNPDANGSFTLSQAQASTTVTCTFTNTRHRANLIVRKRWVNGAAGDQAKLQLSGTNPDLGPVTETSVASGAAGSEIDAANRIRAGVFAGQHITVSESLLPTNTASYEPTLDCVDSAGHDILIASNEFGGTFTLNTAQANSTVTCTFTNTRHRANLIVRKRWVNGAAGDQAELNLTGTNPDLGPLTETSVASGAAGSEIDATNRIRTEVFAGQHLTVSESLLSGNTGSYTSSLACDNGVNPDANGSFTLTAAQANTTVTCTFTNTRQTANLIVRKRWVNGAAGDQADLRLTGTNPDAGPLTTTSVASGAAGSEIDATNRIRTGVFAGQHLTVTESLLPGNTGTYSSSLACDNGVVPNADGTFTLTSAQADTTVTCTFTNTRHSASLIVRKRWVNGAAGDQADLRLTGTNPDAGPLTTTSVASGAAGSEIDAANQLRTGVFTGQHLTVTESLLPDNTGTYSSTLSCDNGVDPNANGQFTLTEAQTNTTVTCTFTNTRHRGNLIVRKRWVNGAAGDQAELSLTGTNPDAGPLTAVSVASGAAGGEIDATNRIRTGVFSGQHITVTESLLPDNTGSYSSSLACDNGVNPDASGQFTLTQAQADTTVTCTFTNTRQTANLIVRKRWVNGAAGDQAELQLSGTNPDVGPLFTTSVASGAAGSEVDGTNRIQTGVFAGQHITVTESLLPGNTGSYASSLACDNGVTPDANGTFTLTADQADTTVTCTFTNTRHGANLIVRKRWVNGAAGDQAELDVSGTNPNMGPLSATSVASGAAGSEIDATNRIHTGVFTGQHITVSESLLSSNTGTYTSSLACDNGVDPDANGQFTLTEAQANATVTCTFTNTRQTANLIVRKRWVDGAAGDQADLRLTGTNPDTGPLTATSVASGAAGSEIDATNRIRIGAFTGQHLTVSESLLPDNTGTYTSSLACDNGVDPNPDGTFTLTAAQADTTVTCTFTNTRQTANLIVRKRWVDGAAGDQAELSVTGTNPDLGPLFATSVASGAAGSEIDATNRIRTGVFAGQVVTVSESLSPGNTGSYDSALDCDNGVTPDANGTFTLTAAQASTTVTCTFTNSRHRANLIVRKRWVNGAAGDQAELHVSGTNPNLGPLTATSVASGSTGSEIDAANRIRTGVLAGQQITVTESLLAGNTGSYDSTLDCDNGVTPDASGTFTVSAAQADTTVTCTFTNTRQTARVVLQKHWSNGAAGDQADLTITGGVTSAATATSSVTTATGSTFTDTANRADTAVRTGEQVTLAESLPPSNTGSYDTTVACDHGVTPNAGGSFTVTADLAATTVVCTITNTRTATPPPSSPPTLAPTSAATSPAGTASPTLAPTAASSPSGPVPLTGDEGGGPGSGSGYDVRLGLGGLVLLVTGAALVAWWRRRRA